ncbi:hypothetical protein [Alkalilimnicola ehrlichii]|uniref:hypothetical protein n=1 Tax=Alkalilimnicola ehrlichii TaxID=351052 RepID=UPI0011C04788|nr:hypothetical protein [Alkalilimnicola ehrlichii]
MRLFTELGSQLEHGQDPTRLVREEIQPIFAGHLLLERYFYDSLEDVADDLVTDDPEVWRNFRDSMKAIARAVNRYLAEVTVGRLRGQEALDKHEQIMAALGKRISDEEERLYLIYERVLGGRAAVTAPREVRARALRVVS